MWFYWFELFKNRLCHHSFCLQSVACRPSCVCCCCYYTWCFKCCKCYGLAMVSIQSPYIFASKYRCFSPSRNLVSCSRLTSWLYFFSCLSYGNVIYGTSYLCYLGYLSYGNFICGTFGICLTTCTTIGITCTIVGTTHTIVGTACTIIGIAHTIVGTANGFILPLIIFYALLFPLHS